MTTHPIASILRLAHPWAAGDMTCLIHACCPVQDLYCTQLGLYCTQLDAATLTAGSLAV